MDFHFAVFSILVLLLVVVAAAPIWPWSRRLGPRPMIMAALCLTLYTLFTVWTV